MTTKFQIEGQFCALSRTPYDHGVAGDPGFLAIENLISYERFVQIVSEVVGREVPVRPVSVAEIMDRRVPLPFPLDCHLVYSGRLAEKELGLEYVPFKQGMKRTFEWYRESVTVRG